MAAPDLESLRMSGAGKALAVLTSGGDAQGQCKSHYRLMGSTRCVSSGRPGDRSSCMRRMNPHTTTHTTPHHNTPLCTTCEGTRSSYHYNASSQDMSSAGTFLHSFSAIYIYYICAEHQADIKAFLLGLIQTDRAPRPLCWTAVCSVCILLGSVYREPIEVNTDSHMSM